MESIQATGTFPAIAPAGLAEFKEVAAQALATASTEAGTLQYDWFFNDDETRCVVRETYSSSEAALAHLANVGALLGRLVALGGGAELVVFGNPSPALREATAGLQPVVHSFFQGK